MKYLFLIPVLVLGACASIIEGSTQTLNVTTNPNTPSNCTASGEGFNSSFTSPGSVTVQKSKNPVTISCTPQNGSAGGTVKILSDISGWGYGGAVLTLGVGAAVDAGTGAANKYPENVVVTLGQNTVVGQTSMNSNADFNK